MADRMIPGAVAAFGGTFNPPHKGHEACLRIALEEFGDRIGQVLVVPSNQQYYKEDARTTAEQRLEMCRLAFGDMEKVQISDMDIKRGGVTYSVDTLHELRACYGVDVPLYFILGSDSFNSLRTWKGADWLRAGFTFVVIPRAGVPVDPQAVRGCKVLIAKTEAPFVSSTDLRARLAAGESVAEDINEQVLCYITDEHLFGSTE